MFQSMSTIRETSDETAELNDGKRHFHEAWEINKANIAKETDSGDEASYSSTTSLDSLADSRARSQKARNITEKRRRDKLNMYINQLAASLPQEGHQRLDKSTILQQGVDYLRKFNDLNANKSSSSGPPSLYFLSADELGDLILESINGAVISINAEWIITFVAEQFKHVFGLEPKQMIGQSIEKFVHVDDLDSFRKKLKSEEREVDDTQKSIPGVGFYGQHLPDDERTLNVDVSFRLATGDVEDGSCREIRCIGQWKEIVATVEKSERKERTLTLMAIPKHQFHLRELCYSSTPVSFSSRHSMDGKFLFVDSSCVLVTGYLPYELMNTSLYFFIHETDLDEVIRAHTSLTTLVDVGSVLVFFRFRSKSNQWLLMKVILRVTYNPMTSKPEYFNASLTLATRDEINQYKKMKLSNAGGYDDGTISYENMLSGGSSLMLASLTRERQIREKSKMRLLAKTGWQTQSETHTSFVRRRPESRAQKSTMASRRKGKFMESLKESEDPLHEQLQEKIERLSISIKKQESQLKKINKMMEAIKPKMFSDGLKNQQEQEQQIYDCLLTTVSEQRKQCQKVRVVLEGKMKISETKRRAMELRGKAKMHKQIAGETSSVQNSVSDQSPGLINDPIQNTTLSPSKTPGLQGSVVSPMQSPIFPHGGSPLHTEFIDEYGVRTDAIRYDSSFTAQVCTEPSSQQSLQIQLQHLQHQQDLLNAQGMALATQGGMSGVQLQMFQSLMLQNRAMLPLCSSNSSSESMLQRPADAGQDGDFHPHGKPPSDSYSQSPNGLQLQVVSQLQNLQQEVQVQLQTLQQNQQSENNSNQTNSVNKIIMQLQHLQRTQMDLLQGNESLSPRPLVDNGLLSPNNGPNDTVTSPPCRMSSRMGNMQGNNVIRQQDSANSIFQMNPLPDPRSPLQMNSNGLRNSHPLSTRQRLSSDDRRPFPQMKSPRNSAGGTPSHLTGTYANNRERNPYNPISFNDPNEPGSSNNREKEKKLQEDDSFNQYVNNLSGQTQQLMQLHQAQRMHILRQQQQQLQALQRNQQQQQQQHLEQQQQQHLQHHQAQLQLNNELNPQGESVSSSLGFNQVPPGLTEDSNDANELAALNQWQNDLQVGQVSALNDLDLFELLSGQSAMNLTEQDEQVLDLLIAEGGDMLPM